MPLIPVDLLSKYLVRKGSYLWKEEGTQPEMEEEEEEEEEKASFFLSPSSSMQQQLEKESKLQSEKALPPSLL